jgi:hypothetical protein
VQAKTVSGIGILSNSQSGVALEAESIDNEGVRARGTIGVHGISTNESESGVFGENVSGGYGVKGSISGTRVYPNSEAFAAVWGDDSGGGLGVKGTTKSGVGVYGASGPGIVMSMADTAGVWGDSEHSVGVYGGSVDGEGLFGFSVSGTGVFAWGEPAIFAWGNLYVMGDQFVSGTKAFQIDHPVEPEEKYLNHFCVESSDLKTMYDGLIVLDASGEAVVELPTWFEALNTDIRYQLTSIGKFAPLYIAEKLSSGRFKIAGGESDLEVAWQITGRRNDPYARLKAVPVEQEKSSLERGRYVHPNCYGAADEQSIAWARHPHLAKRARVQFRQR